MKFNMIKIKRLSGGLLTAASVLFCSTLSLQAQTQSKDTTLTRTVVVEQEYNPDIMDARKVNVLPRVEEITVSPNAVQYDGAMAPAVNIPAESMSAFAGKEVQPDPKQGYVRLGYGNNGNLDAKANYLFLLSARDKLNLSFAMDGMDGKLDMVNTDEKWNSYFYRTRAGLNYLHRFGKADLDIAGNFGLSNFNYLRALPLARQKFTSGDVHLGVASTDDSFPLQFKLETNLLLYSQAFYAFDDKSSNESIVRTKASVSGEISEGQKAGVAVEMNNLFYNNELLENRTLLLLNPYYRWGNDVANIHAGANVDLAFGYGKTFRVSPDISANYIFSDSYVLYAQATGGRRISDFRRYEMTSPYGLIDGQQEDGYEQFNARIGFKASPVSGLWFNLHGGYQDIKNDLYHFFEPIYYPAESSYYPYARTDRSLFYYTSNTNNMYAGLGIKYDYRDMVFVSVGGQYYNWDSDNNDALLMKPEFKLDFQLGVRPISGLHVNLGYQYVQRTKFKDYQEMNAINNLSLDFAYNVFDGVSIYAKASNLLNKSYSYYLTYPAQGINFLGGLSFRF